MATGLAKPPSGGRTPECALEPDEQYGFTCVATYPTRVEDGIVLIELPAASSENAAA